MRRNSALAVPEVASARNALQQHAAEPQAEHVQVLDASEQLRPGRWPLGFCLLAARDAHLA